LKKTRLFSGLLEYCTEESTAPKLCTIC